MNWISSTASRSATRYFIRKSSVLPARMAAISSLVNCSQVTYMMTKSGWGALDLGLDGGQQMGLAKAGAAVDEQRVIGSGGVGRNRLRRSKRKLVGGTLDEVLEGELVIALGRGGVRLVLLGQHHLRAAGCWAPPA